jgi:hypothetical protein
VSCPGRLGGRLLVAFFGSAGDRDLGARFDEADGEGLTKALVAASD